MNTSMFVTLKAYDAYLKLTIHYPNKITFQLDTIVPMAPFTLKSTSKLRSAMHFRYSIVIPCVIPYNPKSNSNNHYNHGFHNTLDYNHCMYSDYVVELSRFTHVKIRFDSIQLGHDPIDSIRFTIHLFRPIRLKYITQSVI